MSNIISRALFPSEIHARQFTEGWTVLEDVEPTPNLDVGKLKFERFFADNVTGITNHKMAVVAVGTNLGLSDLPVVLGELNKRDWLHPELKEDGKYILFPGTLLISPGSSGIDTPGSLYMPYIQYYQYRWHYDTRWIASSCLNLLYRLARPEFGGRQV